jgi:ssDNA-binding Zn-finger/Zn-ribbon topoisomerase 1
MNKKLHPYYKTGIYGWLGEEVDDNDYIICPICGNVLGMNYWDYQAENDGDNKCPECEQELDYGEIYDFEDTCYFEQLLEIKESKIADLEAKLAESEKENTKLKEVVDCVDKLKQFNADMNDYALVNRDVADEIYCEHQDKISFALEQLEKMKEYIKTNLMSFQKVPIIQEINNQIKQLKEMK